MAPGTCVPRGQEVGLIHPGVPAWSGRIVEMTCVSERGFDMTDLWDDYQRSREKMAVVKTDESPGATSEDESPGHAVRSPDGADETIIRCKDTSCCAVRPAGEPANRPISEEPPE